MRGERDQDREGNADRVVELTDAERELLLRICQRYRATIPPYLKSKEQELAGVDALIAKLSQKGPER